jgi:hypothetical protein
MSEKVEKIYLLGVELTTLFEIIQTITLCYYNNMCLFAGVGTESILF